MTTISRNKLSNLYRQLGPGVALTTKDLAILGISADLAVHYVRAGWLKRLARGIYCRPNDPPTLDSSIVLLQRTLKGLHVGGKSALDWYGIRHFVPQHHVLFLYGWRAGRLPGWFTERFPAEYHRKRLFKERPEELLCVQPFEDRKGASPVSTPERAILEMLSEVGVRQPMQEARELVKSSYTLRTSVLHDLLKSCVSVKTVRLCIQLGRELSQPWATNLDASRLPNGSDRRWVSRSADGLLVLKP